LPSHLLGWKKVGVLSTLFGALAGEEGANRLVLADVEARDALLELALHLGPAVLRLAQLDVAFLADFIRTDHNLSQVCAVSTVSKPLIDEHAARLIVAILGYIHGAIVSQGTHAVVEDIVSKVDLYSGSGLGLFHVIFTIGLAVTVVNSVHSSRILFVYKKRFACVFL